jgi:hypothetical protein
LSLRVQKYRYIALAAATIAIAGCQPGDEEEPVPEGAIPAAPDVRPGSEAAPGGLAVPGAQTDSAAGVPRQELPEDQPSAEQAPS